jgi:hypothetical protein
VISQICTKAVFDFSLLSLRTLTAILLLVTIMSFAQINGQAVSGALGLGSLHGRVYGINRDGHTVALPSANITVKATIFMSTVFNQSFSIQRFDD